MTDSPPNNIRQRLYDVCIDACKSMMGVKDAEPYMVAVSSAMSDFVMTGNEAWRAKLPGSSFPGYALVLACSEALRKDATVSFSDDAKRRLSSL